MMKKKMTRQIRFIQPDADEAFIHSIISSEGGRESFFQRKVLLGSDANEQLKSTSHQLKSKYEDILALEQSICELHQMFVDISLLVEQQSDASDEIKAQVQNTVDHVEQGNGNVVKAIQHQKAIHRKRCVFLFIVIAVTVFVVLWI